MSVDRHHLAVLAVIALVGIVLILMARSDRARALRRHVAAPAAASEAR